MHPNAMQREIAKPTAEVRAIESGMQNHFPHKLLYRNVFPRSFPIYNFL